MVDNATRIDCLIVSIKSGNVTSHNREDWNQELIQSGLNTMTGGGGTRRLILYKNNERLMLAWGDCVLNVD